MVTVCQGGIEGIGFEGVKVINDAEVTEMAEMAKMSEVYTWATRHAVVCLMFKKAKMSEMSKMFEMATRHAIICSLESPAV
jgi:hypothetical protein